MSGPRPPEGYGGIVPFFLRVRPADIAYLKFLVESYEGIAVVRTLDPRRALVVLLAAKDFVETVSALVSSLAQELPCEVVEEPGDLGSDWLFRALLEESGSEVE